MNESSNAASKCIEQVTYLYILNGLPFNFKDEKTSSIFFLADCIDVW